MSNNSVYEEDYKGYHIVIESDNDNDDNPRDWDCNLGTMVCWHKRGDYGDRNPAQSPIEFMIHELVFNYDDKTPRGDDYAEDWLMEDAEKVVKQFLKYYVMLPIFAYEHGQITISTRRTGQMCDAFDRGQLGFIYVDKKKILKEFGKKYWTKKLQDKTEDHLIAEVQMYDDFLTGNVYGYMIYQLDNDGDQLDCIDSCWGYYPEHEDRNPDYDGCLKEARSIVDYQVKEDEKEQELLTKRMLNQEV